MAVAFGPFQLSSDGRLRRGRSVVPLAPKETAVLAALVRRRGRMAAKQELLAEIWPDGGVQEGSLTRCICALRAALGDRGRRGRYIETVHGRGYRFVAPLRQARDPAADGGARLLRLSVQPFENATGDAALDPACEELGEALADRLARVQPRRLGVVADPPRGRVSGARPDLLVTGSVRRIAGCVRLRARLVRARDSLQLASLASDCAAAPGVTLAIETLADAAARGLRGPLLRTVGGPRRAQRSRHPSAALP